MNIATATVRINSILAELETATGEIVSRLELRDIDISRMGDVRPEISRSIVIEMQRLPGTHWER